jgi:hypothetical protein
MKLNDTSLFLVAILTLELVGCAHKLAVPVDTTPVSQGLVNIDQSFARIQKEKAKKAIDQIAAVGRKEVADTQVKLSFVQAQADKLTGERDWWKSDSEAKDKTIQQKDFIIKKREKKLDLLGILLASVTAGFVFLALGAVIPYLTPTFAAYAMIGRIGVATLAFTGVFTWVRYL